MSSRADSRSDPDLLAGDADSPSGKSGATWWERYVQDVDGGQIGVVTDQGTATWQLSDIQGNIVASQPASGTAPTGRTEYGSFLNRANDYDYCNQDPYNCLDLDGRKAWDVVAKLGKIGIQFGRDATLWIANAYISEGIGSAAGVMCVFVKMHRLTKFLCTGAVVGIAGSITAAILSKVFRENQCMEGGLQVKTTGVSLIPVAPAPYLKTLNCRDV